MKQYLVIKPLPNPHSAFPSNDTFNETYKVGSVIRIYPPRESGRYPYAQNLKSPSFPFALFPEEIEECFVEIPE